MISFSGFVANSIFLFFYKDFIYLFLERGEEREKEEEKHQLVASRTRPQLRTWPTTQACALTRNQTSDPLVSRLVLSPLSYISQGRTSKS